ncbi:MAG TPA: hypothetical protein VM580_07270 [Labilithrix sp.]|nr:hypothetical protein [Labilithrix sp.]
MNRTTPSGAARALVAGAVLMCSCGGEDAGNDTLSVAWRFESGDCTTNGIDKVRVTATPSGGSGNTNEFACSAGSGNLGKITAGTYSIQGEGIDTAGTARFVHVQSASFPDGKVGGPIDIMLRPKASNVVVTWNGCPEGVVLPYQVAIYRPPASGPALTDKVKATQASCQEKKAKLENIMPGEYVVEVDSRAVTPAVRGTEKVTVVGGQDAEVNVAVP